MPKSRDQQLSEFWQKQEERAANSEFGELTFARARGVTIRDDGLGKWIVHVDGWNADVAYCERWVAAVVVAHSLALAYEKDGH